MKLHEKHANLRNRAYVKSLVAKSVIGSMALEGQDVPEQKVNEIVDKLLIETELKGRKFE